MRAVVLQEGIRTLCKGVQVSNRLAAEGQPGRATAVGARHNSTDRAVGRGLVGLPVRHGLVDPVTRDPILIDLLEAPRSPDPVSPRQVTVDVVVLNPLRLLPLVEGDDRERYARARRIQVIWRSSDDTDTGRKLERLAPLGNGVGGHESDNLCTLCWRVGGLCRS